MSGPMDKSGEPRLSVIVITPGSFDAVRKAVEHILAQDVRETLELVIVAPSRAGLGRLPDDLDALWGWQVVEVGAIDNLGPAEATGFRHARSPVVVYVEEHSYPAAGWARALIEAHARPWAAVGPAVTNANPDRMVSWTSFFLDFGEWVAPGAPGTASALASHQTSYKRDLLLAYGKELDSLLETETALQHDLRRRGHELFFEPRARTNHVNVSRFDEVASLQFHNYREYAHNRATLGGWAPGRRLLYIGGAPLIPLVRGWRVLRQVRRSRLTRRLLPGILPSLALGLIAASFGELVGYSVGKGDSSQKRITFELERFRHLAEPPPL